MLDLGGLYMLDLGARLIQVLVELRTLDLVDPVTTVLADQHTRGLEDLATLDPQELANYVQVFASNPRLLNTIIMTSVNGYDVRISPCCGADFLTPRYSSYNASIATKISPGKTEWRLLCSSCNSMFELINAHVADHLELQTALPQGGFTLEGDTFEDLMADLKLQTVNYLNESGLSTKSTPPLARFVKSADD